VHAFCRLCQLRTPVGSLTIERMHTLSLRTFSIGLLFASVAACSSSSPDSDGPTIEDVTPTVTDNQDGTYAVSLQIDFDDSADTGDLVNAFTFETVGATTDVDLEDQAISPPSGSPITITGITVPMDDAGNAALDYHLELYGASTGLGSVYDGSLTITSSRLRDLQSAANAAAQRVAGKTGGITLKL
jgi:hypothetical protein